jgi:hypothetical protein
LTEKNREATGSKTSTSDVPTYTLLVFASNGQARSEKDDRSHQQRGERERLMETWKRVEALVLDERRL